MKSVTLVLRLIMGAIFLIFGINGFLNFLPSPELSEAGGAFIGALAASGYFFPILKILEISCGLLLLLGRFVPLALVLIAPVTVQIFLFHVFLEPGGMPMAVFLLATNIYLACSHKGSLQGLLKQKG